MPNRETPSSITHALLRKQSADILDLSARVSIMSNEIRDFKHHLYSNGHTKEMGLIERSHNLDKRVHNLEEREKIYLAKWSVLAFLAGGIGSLALWFIKEMFVKK